MLLPEVPPDLYNTPHFDEFSGEAQARYAQVDTAEVLAQLTDEHFAGARWHPGGFMVIFITPAEERAGGQERIHVWPEGIDRSGTDTHEHPWFLGGKPLGEYLEYRPDVTPAVSPADARWLRIHDQFDTGNPDTVHLTPGGLVDVSMGEPHVYGTDDVHVLPVGIFHQTPVVGPLVTWAVMGANRYPASYLRPVGYEPPPIEQPRQQLSEQDQRLARETIRMVLEAA